MSVPLGILSALGSGTPLEAERDLIEAGLSRIDGSAPPFDRSAHDPAHLAVLIGQWRMRMKVEHRSATVFSQLAHQLIERNAPLDTKLVMMRMAQDELRHTGTCAQVVTTLGGDPTIEIELFIQPLAEHRGVPIEERVLRNVLYTTTLSELVACARFSATLERTTEPYLRHALRRLLSDEVLHAQFGFYYLELEKDWLAANPERVASIERYLTHAFAVIEEELAPKPPFPQVPPALSALGCEEPEEAREVFYATMEHATAPGIARFGIDAPRAWRERRRLD
jgi:antitoxin component of RelBE/YafQ-DinJ toxin-antitoxin module